MHNFTIKFEKSLGSLGECEPFVFCCSLKKGLFPGNLCPNQADPSALVLLGCSNKYHRPGACEDKKLLLTVLEVQAHGSSKGPPLGSRLQASRCALPWRKGWGFCAVPFYKTTNPIHGGATLLTSTCPEGPTPVTSKLGIAIST